MPSLFIINNLEDSSPNKQREYEFRSNFRLLKDQGARYRSYARCPGTLSSHLSYLGPRWYWELLQLDGSIHVQT